VQLHEQSNRISVGRKRSTVKALLSMRHLKVNVVRR
jgi:hypothetical protein